MPIETQESVVQTDAAELVVVSYSAEASDVRNEADADWEDRQSHSDGGTHTDSGW
jgi:hypothetical protein